MITTVGIKKNGNYDYLIGIEAGAWPCGIVVMLSELYGAESKAQVYGALHTFLQENKDATARLRMLFIHAWLL